MTTLLPLAYLATGFLWWAWWTSPLELTDPEDRDFAVSVAPLLICLWPIDVAAFCAQKWGGR